MTTTAQHRHCPTTSSTPNQLPSSPSELDNAAWSVGTIPEEPDPQSPVQWRIAGPGIPEILFRQGDTASSDRTDSMWELGTFADRLTTGYQHKRPIASSAP